ncbi:MAG TPA: Hsp20/alpha crystallin family protein [Anaerolineales bacterium]|nr:Hsp20/alpha crystallin family protein [Anaerolineales bacterium]
MTFYLQTYPQNRFRLRPHRGVRRWVENNQHSLNVNIREEDDTFILSALVPGLKADDLNIQILDDVVRIDGEYSLDEEQYLMQELPHGSFTRTLRLPAPIDADSVDAKIKNGVLTLTLPKAESAKPKRISIKSK